MDSVDDCLLPLQLLQGATLSICTLSSDAFHDCDCSAPYPCITTELDVRTSRRGLRSTSYATSQCSKGAYAWVVEAPRVPQTLTARAAVMAFTHWNASRRWRYHLSARFELFVR